MNSSEKRKLYAEFVNWVKSDWKLHIENTLFDQQLTPSPKTKKNFAGEVLAKSSLISEEVLTDFPLLFRHFVAFLLQQKIIGYKKWLVNHQLIANVWLQEKKFSKKESTIINLVIFFDSKKLSQQINADVAKILNTVEQAINSFDYRELSGLGFSKEFEYTLEKIRKAFFVEAEGIARKFELIFKCQAVIINTYDYDEESFREVNGYKLAEWGLPSIFSKTIYQPFLDQTKDHEFKVKGTFLDSSNKFIDIKTTRSIGHHSDRIIIFPANVEDLMNSLDDFMEKHQSLDALFTLNVRDKKGVSKISKNIVRTISEDPINFLMFNNGVTAIVRRIETHEKNNDSVITLHNIKIINGQQTLQTIFAWWKNELEKNMLPYDFSKAHILVKAYQINVDNNNEESKRQANIVYNKISDASNTQIKIKSKDLLSTREFNFDLKHRLLNIGVNYVYRDGASTFAQQFKGMPSISLDELIKMHYIFKTGEVWKRGAIGQVFDMLTSQEKEPHMKSALQKYAFNFNQANGHQVARELFEIAKTQAFYKIQRGKLGSEKQGLDLLVYTALKRIESGQRGDVDIAEFARFCAQEAKDADRNNFYKSSARLKELLPKLAAYYKFSLST